MINVNEIREDINERLGYEYVKADDLEYLPKSHAIYTSAGIGVSYEVGLWLERNGYTKVEYVPMSHTDIMIVAEAL